MVSYPSAPENQWGTHILWNNFSDKDWKPNRSFKRLILDCIAVPSEMLPGTLKQPSEEETGIKSSSKLEKEAFVFLSFI